MHQKLKHPSPNRFVTAQKNNFHCWCVDAVWLSIRLFSNHTFPLCAPGGMHYSWYLKFTAFSLATCSLFWYSFLRYLYMVTSTFRIQLRHHSFWKVLLTPESESGASSGQARPGHVELSCSVFRSASHAGLCLTYSMFPVSSTPLAQGRGSKTFAGRWTVSWKILL